jgi:hypothetical protein
MMLGGDKVGRLGADGGGRCIVILVGWDRGGMGTELGSGNAAMLVGAE